jgi:hypothetical protein
MLVLNPDGDEIYEFNSCVDTEYKSKNAKDLDYEGQRGKAGKGLGVERVWSWQKTGGRVIGMEECIGRFDEGFDLAHVKGARVMEWQGERDAELKDGVRLEEVLKFIL